MLVSFEAIKIQKYIELAKNFVFPKKILEQKAIGNFTLLCLLTIT